MGREGVCRKPSSRRNQWGIRSRVCCLLVFAVVTALAYASHPVPVTAATAATDPTDPPTPPPGWSAVIHEYPMPNTPGSTKSQLAGLTVGPDGNLWVTEGGYSFPGNTNAAMDRVTTGGVATQFASASSQGITAGPDGALWFTTYATPSFAPAIARMTTAGVVSNTYQLPGFPSFQGLNQITTGPDGALWFSNSEDQYVGSITTSGQVTRYAISSYQSGGITTGPDGNVWIAETNSGRIARITPGGTVTEFPIPARNALLGGAPQRIVTGPDGNLWFTDAGNNSIDRITTSGSVTIYPIPTTSAFPFGITVGPDHDLWFTESAATRIGRLNPATGQVIEFHIPTSRSAPLEITAGPDGKLWFDESIGVCTDGFDCSPPSLASLDPATVQPPPAPCMVVTADTTLKHDVGPCPGDGIDVSANNVTLNLNGHRVFSNGGLRTGDFAGVHLMGVSGVNVVGGHPGSQVTGFDAGVFIDHGANNVVTGLDVHDNVGSLDPGNSLLGDGIVGFHTSGNRIADNSVVHNGIFDGIGLLGLHTDNNTVTGNYVSGNTDFLQRAPGGGTGIITNAFLEFENPGRGHSVVGNNIIGNTVVNYDNSGISDASNTHALIARNVISGNGFVEFDPGNGLGDQFLFNANPATYDTVTANTVTGNAGDGIQVGGQHNTITYNTTNSNGGPSGLDGYDLDDLSTFGQSCLHNTWFGNTWGIAGWSPACVTVGGSGPNPPTSPAAAAVPRTASNSPTATSGAQWFSRGKSVPTG